MSACASVQTDLGAYVLGGLTGPERDAVDRHLLDCPACAAELSELEDAADLLSRVSPADLVPADVVPADRVPDELAARRDRRRTRLVALSAAAAVVALAVGIGVGVNSGHASSHTFAASSAGVTMSAQVHDQPGGTAFSLVVNGLPQAEHCTLVAISRTGARQPAGSWTADYERATHVVETSSFSTAQLAGLELDGSDGKELVTVPIG